MTNAAVPVVDESLKHRSKLSNGRKTLFGDNRSTGARRYKDILAELAKECGSLSHLPESGRQTVRRLAALSVECELLESRRAAGQELDPAAYALAFNAHRRATKDFAVLKKLHGPKPQSLAEYLAARSHADVAPAAGP